MHSFVQTSARVPPDEKKSKYITNPILIYAVALHVGCALWGARVRAHTHAHTPPFGRAQPGGRPSDATKHWLFIHGARSHIADSLLELAGRRARVSE